MSIASDLAAELKDAMLNKDARRRDVIRQVQTEITLARSEPGYDSANDDEVVQGVIESYSKRMQKSIAEYEGYGERGADMAEKLKFEVDYLSRWMPQRLPIQRCAPSPCLGTPAGRCTWRCRRTRRRRAS